MKATTILIVLIVAVSLTACALQKPSTDPEVERGSEPTATFTTKILAIPPLGFATATPVSQLPEPAATPTQAPVSETSRPVSPTFTRRPTSTATTTVLPHGPGINGLCRALVPANKAKTTDDAKWIYFRVERQGWYRTDNLFETNQPVAPYGELSRDLKYLVTFNCQGQGSICVASPPTSAPIMVQSSSELSQGDFAFRARWLADNRRLIFWAGAKTPDGNLDARLYMLNVLDDQVIEIDRGLRYGWDVSPIGDCVSYSAFKEEIAGMQFQIAALNEDGVREVWRAPSAPIYDVLWPEYDDPMAWSGDGKQLAFYLSDAAQIRIWDIEEGYQRTYRLCVRGKEPCNPSILRWSPKDNLIYLTTGNHWLLDVGAGHFSEEGEARGVGYPSMYQWLPDGNSIVVVGLSGSALLQVAGDGVRELQYSGKESHQAIDDLFRQKSG